MRVLPRPNGWWFEPVDGVLGYGDGRKPRRGVTHRVGVEPVLCEAGLHWCEKPLDALNYADGSCRLWRVHGGGTVVRDNDKCAGTQRTYLWRIDAEDVLRRFARLCALDVIDKWNAPEEVVRYLKTGNKSLRDAAYSAASSAAYSAAYSAASYEAYSAARRKQNARLVRMLNAEARRQGVIA